MKKEELIKYFEEDKYKAKFKNQIAELVNKLNENSDEKAYAGVEISSFYILDSEYHIFKGKFHVKIMKEQQDPWFPDYYIVIQNKKKTYCYNDKELEETVRELLNNKGV